MAETIEPSNELGATAEGPELYVRVNVEKQAKGYKHETTVSMRWIDMIYPSRETGEPEGQWIRTTDAWGTRIDQPARLVLQEILRMADTEARSEIVRREALDAAEKAEAAS